MICESRVCVGEDGREYEMNRNVHSIVGWEIEVTSIDHIVPAYMSWSIELGGYLLVSGGWPGAWSGCQLQLRLGCRGPHGKFGDTRGVAADHQRREGSRRETISYSTACEAGLKCHLRGSIQKHPSTSWSLVIKAKGVKVQSHEVILDCSL